MEATFEKLKLLQEVLKDKFAIEKEIGDIPKALETKTEVLNRAKKTFIERNDLSTQLKVKLRTLQLDMTAAAQGREAYEKQMDQIKTQKEFEALEKELGASIEKEQGLRKEIQRVEKELEELQLQLSKQEKQIAMDEVELKDEEAQISHLISDKQKLMDELSKREADITKDGMDGDLLFKFERIIRNKAGLGIVAIKGGVCSGCHMILPMQFVNEVRNISKSEDVNKNTNPLFCPYCSRILFWESNMDPSFQPEVDNEAGKLADLVDEE